MSALARLAAGRTLLVVPGGGPFADEVRRADRRFPLGDSAAHWMAVLAMDQYAHLLARLAGSAQPVQAPREVAGGRLNVLAPFRWLRARDPLPHTWRVTSDSIAAWVAGEVRAGMLVLLKDVDGVFERDRRSGAPRLRRRVARERVRGVVDPCFRLALAPGMRCWIVNGTRPARVRRLIETGSTYGTEVT